MLRRVKVFGLGNVLMRDDGIGPLVARMLHAEWLLPPDVDVEELGTPGPRLAPQMRGARAVVLVDTVLEDLRPGSVRIYRGRAAFPPRTSPRLAPHGEYAGDLTLVGVVPARVEAGPGLTPALRTALPEIVSAVLGELLRLGRAGVRRPRPLAHNVWWERGAALAQ